MSAETVQALVAAVRPDGFVPRLVGRGLELHGDISVKGIAVPLALKFEDLTLAQSPRVYLPDVSRLNRKVVPHRGEDGEFCVVDRRFHVFDRFQAAAQTRGLIVRAGEILERGMTKAGTAEIAEEFMSYWSDQLCDLPGEKRAPGIGSVTTAARLSFEAHHEKPETFGSLLDWAGFWDKALPEKIIEAFTRLHAADPILVVHAPNATIVAQLQVSARSSKFVESLARAPAWQRYVRSADGRSIRIKRYRGQRLDLQKIFGANGADGRPPLAGREIVLIGCGAIGGYLGRMLAQSGAGLENRLHLIDDDRLDRDNVRRHQLGLGDLERPKAEACADAIARDFPGVDLKAVIGKAQAHERLLAAADLVIDATGEQEFSEWLNAWALSRAPGESPAVLYAWIAGHGAAAQSFLSRHENYACYRCLQPDLSVPGRFDPLRGPAPEPVAACGEQAFTPYGPAASMAAASLAAAHANDWALGRPHHLLRTVRIDWDATVKRDPCSPDRARNCPACSAKPA